MTRTPTSSSLIKTFGHFGSLLEIEFPNGKVYQYADISPEDMTAFLKSESKGSAFSKIIRPKYAGQLVKEEK